MFERLIAWIDIDASIESIQCVCRFFDKPFDLGFGCRFRCECNRLIFKFLSFSAIEIELEFEFGVARLDDADEDEVIGREPMGVWRYEGVSRNSLSA